MNDKKYEVIKTSDEKWLEKSLKYYVYKQPFQFIDDAGLGIREKDLKSAVALIKRSREKNIARWKQIARLLTSVGITGVGVWIIWLAIIDPEPTSKLSILVIGGITLALTGSLSTLKSLGQTWRISVSKFGTTITVEPKDDGKDNP